MKPKYKKGRQLINVYDFETRLEEDGVVVFHPMFVEHHKVLNKAFLNCWQFGVVMGLIRRGSFYKADKLCR